MRIVDAPGRAFKPGDDPCAQIPVEFDSLLLLQARRFWMGGSGRRGVRCPPGQQAAARRGRLRRFRRLEPAMRLLLFAALLVAAATDATAAKTRRVFIAGDSTASAYGPERAPRAGWGMALPSFLGPPWEVRNHALSGRSSRSFVEQGALDGIAQELRSGDVLLIQFGHNDAKREDPSRYTEPEAGFPAQLRRYLAVARERGATPILVTPLARRVFEQGRLIDTHGVYAQAVRDLARSEKVGLIDLTARSMDWLRALGDGPSKLFYMYLPEQQQEDDTHTQWRGATAVACFVVDEWKKLDSSLAADVMRDTDCGARASALDDRIAQPAPSGVVHGDELARRQPGPHGGAGSTTAYPYFADAPGMPFQFRKRALHPGAGIGLHQHDHDEIYYVLAGRGDYALDGELHEVGAGDVLLTRTGSTHSLQQKGDEDLVILITYLVQPAH
jgi:lysophospholipase L1-like esterase/quercetin dioxygenase-like cupin family protein